MIRVLDIEILNLQDDVVFNNPAIVLYASGCNWKCKYCHSKHTWDFNQGYEYHAKDMISLLDSMKGYTQDLTILGEGGDFFFQLFNWFDFIKQVKESHPWIKVVWSTGASLNVIRNIFNRFKDMKPYFDAILCDKPFKDRLNANIKTLYTPYNDSYKKVLITTNGGLIHAC